MNRKDTVDGQLEAALARIRNALQRYEQTGQSGKKEQLAKRLREMAGPDAAGSARMADAEKRMAEAERLVKWAAAQYLKSRGATAGEYLAEQLCGAFPPAAGEAQMEALLKAARERYPALFKRALTGVRPMEGGAGEMDEMPLKERMRMANEDPEGYMRMFW